MFLSRLAFVVTLLLPANSMAEILDGYLEQRIPMEMLPQLYGGTKSLDTEFLPMGWIGNCTGTAVGDKVIFTAAHCATNGKKITFVPRFNKQQYGMTCSRHPRVRTGSWYNDFALCVLDFGEFPNEMPKASFEFRKPDVGEKLLLNGYGAPTVGTHHWGGENVDNFDGQDIEMCGKVYLGGGDSGGSLLAWSNDRTGKLGFNVLGVNSRGGGNCSYFNTVADGEFESWASQYETQKNVELCGLSANCKTFSPSPSPSPVPSPTEVPRPANCWQVYEEFAFCIGTSKLRECILRAEQLKVCVQ